MYAYDLIGMYQECPDGKPKCKDEEKHQTIEDSFFVPYRESGWDLEGFAEFFLGLAIKYNQDSILLGLPSEYSYDTDTIEVAGNPLQTGQHYYVYRNGKVDSVGTRLEMETLKDYGSIAVDDKDRFIEFVIKGVLQPNTVSGCVMFQKKGLKWFHEPQQLNDRTKSILKRRKG